MEKKDYLILIIAIALIVSGLIWMTTITVTALVGTVLVLLFIVVKTYVKNTRELKREFKNLQNLQNLNKTE